MAFIPTKEAIMYIPELEDNSFIQSVAGFNVGYRTLATLPLGISFYNGGAVFTFEDSIKEEKAIMKKSLVEKKEYGLVKAGDKIRIVRGRDYYIRQKEALKALEIVENDGEGCIDSHTHWETRLEEAKRFPLASVQDFSFWIDLREKYPLIECRVVLWAGNRIGALTYLGWYKDLYGERFNPEEHRRFILSES